MRVEISVEAPGGNGTTRVTRPLGKFCALRRSHLPQPPYRPPRRRAAPVLLFSSSASSPLLSFLSSVSKYDLPRPALKGRLGHDRPDLPLHADQLRRQGRGRTGGQADHAGPQSHGRRVRLPGLVLLLPVRRRRRGRRLPRQPDPDEAHAVRHGDHLVAGAVPDAGRRHAADAGDLPHRAGRRRRPCRSGGDCIRSTNGFPIPCAASRPRSWRKARRSASSSRCQRSTTSSSITRGSGRSARWASSACCGPCYG